MSQGRYVSGELVRSVYVVNMSSGGGSGTPGGSNTQIQFNNAGVFGGVANSSVNNATGNITLGNRVSVPLGTAALPSIYPGTDTNTGIYSPGADQLAVATNGTGRLFINATGNVGIGTTSPTTPLEIASSGTANALISAFDATASRAYFQVGGTTSGRYTQIGTDTSTTFINDYFGTGIAFQLSASEKARIDSGGRLLVGTSTALSNLSYEATSTLSPQIQVVGSSASTAHIGVVRTSGNGASYLTLGWGSDGNVAASNQYIGVLLFSAFDGSVYRNAAYIQCEADGAHAAGDTPGRLLFSTTADGASSPTERLRINSVGQTMVNSAGTAAAPVISKVGDTNTGIFFPAADTIAFAEGGAEAARIDSSGRFLVGTSTARAFSGAVHKIQIEDATGSGSGRIVIGTNNNLNTTGPGIYFFRSRGGALGSNTIVQNDDLVGSLFFQGADGTDINSRAAEISAVVDGTPGADDMPGRLVFSTTADGASSTTERMRITSDAYVRLAAGTGGIQFNGDTAAANALDDYEDGTWTPIFVPQTGSFNSITYDSTRAGNYTKVGNLVTVWGIIRTDSVDATGASGLLAIGGLPFSVGTGTTGGGFAVNLLNWAGEYPSSVRPSVGETFAYLGYRTAIDGNDTISNVSDLTTGTGDANRLTFQFSYRV
jgi:hypothetical protein